MEKKLRIFDIFISDEDETQGVSFISLVDDPAIKVNWIKLKEEEPLMDVNLAFRIDGTGICFGCPPDGDGKRTDGSPDRRCADNRDVKGTPPSEKKATGSPKKGDIKDKIKSGNDVDANPEETQKVRKAMRDKIPVDTQESRDGRTKKISSDYAVEWSSVNSKGEKTGFLVKDWSYTSKDGIPAMGNTTGSSKYYNGSEIAVITERKDGSRKYSFPKPKEKDDFFKKLGII